MSQGVENPRISCHEYKLRLISPQGNLYLWIVSEKLAAVVKQIAQASLVSWAAALVVALLLRWTLGVSLTGALARAAFVVGVLLFGAGAASIGGGVVATRPLGPMHHWWKPVRRDDVPRLPDPLTPLGVALFVGPQLISVGVLLYE